MRSLKVGFSLVLICLVAYSQTALDNSAVLKLLKAGIAEDTIIAMVNQQPGNYVTSADEIVALKKAGVTDRIIAAIITREGSNSIKSVAVAAPTAVPASSQMPSQPNVTESTSCLIVKHKGTVGRRLLWTALIGVPIAPGAKYDFVDGFNVKSGKMSYKGKELEAMQSAGARVIVLDNKHTPEDVESARAACRGDLPAPSQPVAIAPPAYGRVMPQPIPQPVAASSTTTVVSSAKSTPAPMAVPVEITFLSIPADATVAMSGKPLGRTPFTIKLQPGTYNAQFSADGFAEAIGNVPVEAGHPNTFTFVLHANN